MVVAVPEPVQLAQLVQPPQLAVSVAQVYLVERSRELPMEAAVALTERTRLQPLVVQPEAMAAADLVVAVQPRLALT
jgi:hypothetical protein